MQLAYLYTSVWISRIEGFTDYQKKVRSELLALEADGWNFCYSGFTILETLIKPQRSDQTGLIRIYNQAFSKAVHLPDFDNVFQQALHLSSIYQLKSMDAIHLAFAVKYDCELFVTTDPDFLSLKSVPLHYIDLSQVISS